MTADEARAKIRSGKLVTVTCTRESPQGQGYVGDVFDDRFELHVVTNAQAHFSNLSAPPETVSHIVYFKDIINVF